MFDIEEELDELSYADTPEIADRESARRVLARMFPELDEEEFIELEEGKLMRHTLNRVMETMLHLNGVTFSMDRTMSNDVFYRAKEEAYDLEQWLDSPDDTPKPESLKYKEPVVEQEEDHSDDGEKKSIGPYTRRKRGPSSTSKYQRAIGIYKELKETNAKRGEIVEVLMERLELAKSVAESYYSKVKNEVESI